MPKILYVEMAIGAKRLGVIEQANEIIEEYAAQGYELTLRQLYYQFVARDLIPNKQTEYKKLGATINDGRLAGLIDWNAITDRTRELRAVPHWENPADIVTDSADQFRLDKWSTQPVRIEVWIEKDALIGVIEGVCERLDVPFFSCRGYTSQSELWRAGMRLKFYETQEKKDTLVIHLGDLDPSGVDMTRDIQDRLRVFGADTEVRRIALNMDQVKQYGPPPNPAKTTDSRYEGYIREYGEESWELDALEPSVLVELIEEHVTKERDDTLWRLRQNSEDADRERLSRVAERWDDIELED